jgi:[glutamine synthetase] adenylyltransferase / [glutamine synthetase]-adenylyl-L-tyrosine phosphorylase
MNVTTRPVRFALPAAWPLPSDEGAADRLVERFAALGRAEAKLAASPAGTAMLRSLGGNSTYLADLTLREAAALRELCVQGPDAVVAAAMARLRAIPPTTERKRLAALLREGKRIIALATAVADIGGIWKLEQVTEALTALAETALSRSVAHLLRSAHDAGELRLPDPDDPEAGGGFTVLGMGKLGARELNYSSDVDLVLLYDPAAPIYTEATAPEAIGAFTARFARGLVALMEARDSDGYVFRTDLRLRPDPAATPPVVALPAAIAYYESMGQNWERAAMVKARPVAGDLALGLEFLDAIRPFVWRRGLDFAAVADIHAMKRRIDTQTLSRTRSKHGAVERPTGDAVTRIAGHNVKLGEGGIREIEFVAQTLQLVWGGRDPGLRVPGTIGALRALARAGLLARRTATELTASYRFLRQVEHRIQMVADRQTHSLPEQSAELMRIAVFLGYADAPDFAEALLRHLRRVRRDYRAVFEQVPDLPPSAGVGGELDFRGHADAAPATLAALRAMGFTELDRIVAAVRSWQSGRLRALRSPRSQELLAQVLPAVLAALARQPQPDAAFARFDGFLARLPAGVQLLSLFHRNPPLIERVAAVLGAAPILGDFLASHPTALDGLLSGDDDAEPEPLLRGRLRDARQLEEAIEITRRTVREAAFAISVAMMEGRIDTDEAGLRRTALADAAMAALLEPVMAEFAARFGRVPGGAVAVVALGKAGGREMMAGSDLDLMLIYDHPEASTDSRGKRALPTSQWFVRLAHAYVAALTAPGVDGPLYPVDMRLRPSGNKGPVAVSLSAFRSYHQEAAWTWERMALTRARVIAGPATLRKHIEGAIHAAIVASGTPARIRTDAAQMRTRLARDLPPSGRWDVKLRVGGQIEVEFVSQVLQLIAAPTRPAVLSQTTRDALRHLGAAGLLPPEDAALLIRADRIWRTVQGMLRITLGRTVPAELPDAPARALLRAAAQAGAEAVDLPGLQATLETLAAAVRAAFVRHVGEVKA